MVVLTLLLANFPFWSSVEASDDNVADQQEISLTPYVMGFNDYRISSVVTGVTNSTDGGATWQPNQQLYFGSTIDGDQCFRRASDSLIHAYWMHYSTSPTAVVHATSTDGGATWSAGAKINSISGGTFVDKVWVTVKGDSVFGTYLYSAGTYEERWFRSVDGGVTYDEGTLPGWPGTDYIGYVNMDSVGKVYNFWNHYNSSTNRWWGMSVSTDGGLTWSAADSVTNIDQAGGSVRNFAIPSIIGLGDGQLMMLWSDGRFAGSGSNWDIVCLTSTDGGTSWALAVKVNDDPATSAAQLMPALARDPATGRVFAFWFDRREGAWAIYYSYTDDWGATWAPNGRVSDTTWAGEWFMGDYMDAFVWNGFVCAGWADGRGGSSKLDAYYSCAALGNVGTVERPAKPSQLRLRVVGRTVRLALPAAGRARLTLYDGAGRLVATLARGRLAAGEHALALPDVPSGVYVLRLTSGGASATAKTAVVR